MTDQNHGLEQAQAQAASIVSMVAALNCDFDRLQELRDEREALADAVEEAETTEEQCHRFSTLNEAIATLAAWDAESGEELNTLEHEAGDCTDQDEARQRIEEDALSVEVRSGWDDPSSTERGIPFEFRIVVCTGGPHVEIRGELDDNGTPCRAWLQYQDWGTPMTRHFDIEQSTLLAYCQVFYFGE